jgi:hypothetical protein
MRLYQQRPQSIHLNHDLAATWPHKVHFVSRSGAIKKFPCYFSAAIAQSSAASHLRFMGLRPVSEHRETNMKQILKTSIAPITALCALAFFTMATPASAGEYCRKDVTSAVVSCSFDTLAQCQDMSSGRGGDCYRDPFLADARSALAYAPKALHSNARAHRAKAAVEQ